MANGLRYDWFCPECGRIRRRIPNPPPWCVLCSRRFERYAGVFHLEQRVTHLIAGRWYFCLFDGTNECPNNDHRTEHRYTTPWQPTKETEHGEHA